jgi:DNA-binding GntR family transcriptional regulator
MTPPAQISRSPLSDQIKDRLLQEILAGVYPPGSRIVETRVARELGTSQAPVREALRDLEALGVIEISAFRGAHVRHPTKAELIEAYEIRAELESLGAKLALPKIAEPDLEELAGYVDEMLSAADRGDSHAEAVADFQFHARVVEISGNHTLERVWRTLEPLSRTYITLIVPGVDRRRVARLHIPILEALRGGDPLVAAEAYHEHFQNAAATFRETWVDDVPSVTTRRVRREPGRRGHTRIPVVSRTRPSVER